MTPKQKNLALRIEAERLDRRNVSLGWQTSGAQADYVHGLMADRPRVKFFIPDQPPLKRLAERAHFDGWVSWDASDLTTDPPENVAGVRCRDGDVFMFSPKASDDYWRHRGQTAEIVAYLPCQQ